MVPMQILPCKKFYKVDIDDHTEYETIQVRYQKYGMSKLPKNLRMVLSFARLKLFAGYIQIAQCCLVKKICGDG
jgi:hypothetical protein